jgi:hypothetical protein
MFKTFLSPFRASIIVVLLACAVLPTFAQSSKESSSDPIQKLAFDGLKLRSIGPAITSGRISSIAVHPANKSTWYIAAASGGVWKTINGGISGRRFLKMKHRIRLAA